MCFCGDPALLPSGGLSVSGAAEERGTHVAAWKRAGTCSPPSLSLSRSRLSFPSLVFPPTSPLVISHGQTSADPHPGGPRRSHYFSFFTCSASVCVCVCVCVHFSIFPLLPLCLFMLLLLLLPDIFRDELQSTAGGKKKNRGGAVSATCVPLPSFSLFMRTSSFPCRTSAFPSRLSLSLSFSICLCPLYIPLKSITSSFFL